ncbi:hypothetical protein ACE1TI_13805 [Alteribacillus sp. JSM 102045]|uniref:hypothetical protein n=1 Tax=Alteribacillus sp. JSM 102045 TaxID=1562101 RepID=UPI0035BF1CFA
MRFITMLFGAGLFFLSGMITGYHYAQSHWLDVEHVSGLSEEIEQETEKTVEKEQESSGDLSSDLLKRQEVIKEEGTENMFSRIGQSLDVFNPSSNSQ